MGICSVGLGMRSSAPTAARALLLADGPKLEKAPAAAAAAADAGVVAPEPPGITCTTAQFHASVRARMRGWVEHRSGTEHWLGTAWHPAYRSIRSIQPCWHPLA